MTCVKCGSDDIYTRWHRGIDDCSYSERKRRGYQEKRAELDPEHLHRTCRGCGFDWTTRPADADSHDG